MPAIKFSLCLPSLPLHSPARLAVCVVAAAALGGCNLISALNAFNPFARDDVVILRHAQTEDLLLCGGGDDAETEQDTCIDRARAQGYQKVGGYNAP